jgi:hypothetical protein
MKQFARMFRHQRSHYFYDAHGHHLTLRGIQGNAIYFSG